LVLTGDGGGFCQHFSIFSRTLANSICLLPEDLIKKVESMQTKFFKGKQNVAGISPNFPEAPQRMRQKEEMPQTWQTLAEHLVIIAHHQRQDTKITEATKNKVDAKPLVFDSFVSNTFKVNCGRPNSKDTVGVRLWVWL